MTKELLASDAVAAVPRAIGSLNLSTKRHSAGSGIADFRTSGSTKVVFPRRTDAVEGIVINTSGGLTGGDRFEARVEAGADSRLVLTTQAAERAYRSQQGTARVNTQLHVKAGAVLHWLPQEFIIFNAASVERRLRVDLDAEAELVLVEPLVFGRQAMGEHLTSGAIRETIQIYRDNALLFADRIHLSGAIEARLGQAAVARGMTAMASVIYHGPRAESLLAQARPLLPVMGGATLMAPDLLCMRLLAGDSFLLRRRLVPLLETVTAASLPKSWSL